MTDLLKTFARISRPLRDAAKRISSGRASNEHQARYYYLGPDLALVRLKSGQHLYVDPKDELISTRIIMRGHWEFWTTKAVLSLLRKGDTVLEVGTNLGYYTVLMADAVGISGSVIGLEANARMVSMANKSLAINNFSGHARVLHRAATDSPGPVSFVSSRMNSGAGHIEVLAVAPFEDAVTSEVEGVRLDDLGTARVDFLRLDAEGSESAILHGATQVIADNPGLVICMEWSPVQIASRTSVPDFVDWMVSLGFRFWKIGKDARLSAIDAQILKTLDHTDIVACRRDISQRD